MPATAATAVPIACPSGRFLASLLRDRPRMGILFPLTWGVQTIAESARKAVWGSTGIEVEA
ncbi:hypothetical protein [Frankia sp. Cr2]|uniref:hypothetical protein n=1 Tax=Frankia sp. Cr2 TaxID=3073932 RepID=UPI002AD322C9|nr:hypothetical protein [Frankia sp. Cr2]